ncbi:hypothetical protein K7X08_034641 [Anisodus acutangulus]|uniref:Uncharacterized protein n=1 Tax=Anisodus acutangulus TaxID=402998 RepID=A0A9Q1LIY4_9SOLA|nr:hypothetical protein K7X08_034641 [Anisodus acutangulus]
MPCHISHSWHDEVAQGSSVPVLHMGEVHCQRAQRSKFATTRSWEYSANWVLASDATLSAGVYQEKLQNEVLQWFLELFYHTSYRRRCMIPSMSSAIQKAELCKGFEVVLPDKATMEHAVIPAVEALNRKDIEGAQNLFRIPRQVLLVRAVNTIIIASDDMRDLLPPDDPLLKKCFDPIDALARSTVEFVHSVERNA